MSDLIADLLKVDDPYRAAGLWCRDQREGRGWTQTDLSNRLGLGRTSIVNFEAGRQRILLHTFIDLCRIFATDNMPAPKPVVRAEYQSACDCPKGWVTCDRRPCARAEAIVKGIRAFSETATLADLEAVGAISHEPPPQSGDAAT